MGFFFKSSGKTKKKLYHTLNDKFIFTNDSQFSNSIFHSRQLTALNQN
jgi:hypothetical protein